MIIIQGRGDSNSKKTENKSEVKQGSAVNQKQEKLIVKAQIKPIRQVAKSTKQEAKKGNSMHSNMMNSRCSCCSNDLEVNFLCADCIKAKRIVAHSICSRDGKFNMLSAENEVVNTLCSSGQVQAKELWSDKSFANSLCVSGSASINNLCVNNLMVGNQSGPCITQRATVNYSMDTNYILGGFLNFDNIVDDPNNNISLIPNTSYTAPVSGYYTLTLKISALNLTSNDPIIGIPVANPEIYVNGVVVRESFSPFLSFFNGQKILLNSLITLRAGDVVTMKYQVLAANGLPLVGSVDIVGTGIEDGNSFFKIMLLSGLCEAGEPIVCEPCPIVEIPCQPVVVNCCDPEPEPCRSC